MFGHVRPFVCLSVQIGCAFKMVTISKWSRIRRSITLLIFNRNLPIRCGKTSLFFLCVLFMRYLFKLIDFECNDSNAL